MARAKKSKNPTVPGRRSHHRLGAHAFDLHAFFDEVFHEEAATRVQGLLRNFVCKDGVTTPGTAFGPTGSAYDSIKQLRESFGKENQGGFKPNEAGCHTVTLVYFDKGADGIYRFFQVVSDEMHFHA
jgi:hypothetical protein